jgi:hypothetical protein
MTVAGWGEIIVAGHPGPHCHAPLMETHAFGFKLRANGPEGQKRFPIGNAKGDSRPGAELDDCIVSPFGPNR